MNQAQLESLLGRPLTPVEVENRSLYLDIARETLETMICSRLDQVTETRTFDTREGFRTVFIGYFTDISKVTYKGEELTDFSKRMWDERNSDFFNSIVFDGQLNGAEIEIEADWGFDCLPKDLLQLQAKLFAQVSAKNTNNSNISSKKVEDFSITFRNDLTLDEQFAQDNASVIGKYSLCSTGNVKSGALYCGRVSNFYY